MQPGESARGGLEIADGALDGARVALVVAHDLLAQLLLYERQIVHEGGVVGRDVARTQQHLLAVDEPVGLVQGAYEVGEQLDVGVLVELLGAVLVHLDGANVLALLDQDVRDVEPHVAEVGGGLAHLGEDVARLVEQTHVGEDAADAVGRPDVARIDAQHALIHGQRALLVTLLLVLVAVDLVECVQPDVAQRDQRVRVVLVALDDAVEDVLGRTQLFFVQVQVAF